MLTYMWSRMELKLMENLVKLDYKYFFKKKSTDQVYTKQWNDRRRETILL